MPTWKFFNISEILKSMNNELSTNFKYVNLCTIPVSLFVGTFPAVFNSNVNFFPREYIL